MRFSQATFSQPRSSRDSLPESPSQKLTLLGARLSCDFSAGFLPIPRHQEPSGVMQAPLAASFLAVLTVREMHRANEIASIKVRLEEIRQALEHIRADPDLTVDEQSLLALELRREMLILEQRWADIIRGGDC
jgi:hypothetical protein